MHIIDSSSIAQILSALTLSAHTRSIHRTVNSTQ